MARRVVPSVLSLPRGWILGYDWKSTHAFAVNETHTAMRSFAQQLIAGDGLKDDFSEAGACGVIMRRLSDLTFMDVSGPYANFGDTQISAMRLQAELSEEGEVDYVVEIRPLFSPRDQST